MRAAIDVAYAASEASERLLTGHGIRAQVRAALCRVLSHGPGDVAWPLRIKPSRIPGAGLGLFADVHVPAHSVVALYPGGVYYPGDPAALPSVRNGYFVSCCSGVRIDGRYYGLSAWLYRSSAGRVNDPLAPVCAVDTTWLNVRAARRAVPDLVDHAPAAFQLANPLAVGQLINTPPPGLLPNTLYYEVLMSIPQQRRRALLPNLRLFLPDAHGPVRTLAMVTMRDIAAGEELLAYYNFIGRPVPGTDGDDSDDDDDDDD